MPYKTILIDDEKLALQRLERLLLPHRDLVEIIDHATDGETAIAKIEALRPDLIFLDIQMPECDGFEVLQHLRHSPWVLFATAYDEFALKAFETNAIDYLLKPIDPERLQRALEKLQRLTGENQQAVPGQWQNLLASLPKATPKRLLVRSGDRIRFLNVKDLHFLKAEDKYVVAHTFAEAFVLDQTLQQLEAVLPQQDFVRIHRAAIVNLSHVAEAVRMFGGNYVVRMRDKQKSELPVSRQSKAKLGLTRT